MDNKFIQLTRGAVAVVSPEDYERISKFTWHLTSHGYGARRAPEGTVYLHREVNRTPPGYSTDHIDGNKLNCARENLRTATDHQNSVNKSKLSGTSSKFKGVFLKRGAGKDPTKNVRWMARITCKYKGIHLGYYVTELDAAWAYNIAAKAMFGEFAKLNELPVDLMLRQTEPKRFQEPKYSRFFGVSKHRKSGLWFSWVNKDGKKAHTKYFKNEEDAARDRDQAALRLLGPMAKLNFPT